MPLFVFVFPNSAIMFLKQAFISHLIICFSRHQTVRKRSFVCQFCSFSNCTPSVFHLVRLLLLLVHVCHSLHYFYTNPLILLMLTCPPLKYLECTSLSKINLPSPPSPPCVPCLKSLSYSNKAIQPSDRPLLLVPVFGRVLL